MVLRVGPTLTLIPINILYTPLCHSSEQLFAVALQLFEKVSMEDWINHWFLLAKMESFGLCESSYMQVIDALSQATRINSGAPQ